MQRENLSGGKMKRSDQKVTNEDENRDIERKAGHD